MKSDNYVVPFVPAFQGALGTQTRELQVGIYGRPRKGASPRLIGWGSGTEADIRLAILLSTNHGFGNGSDMFGMEIRLRCISIPSDSASINRMFN